MNCGDGLSERLKGSNKKHSYDSFALDQARDVRVAPGHLIKRSPPAFLSE